MLQDATRFEARAPDNRQQRTTENAAGCGLTKTAAPIDHAYLSRFTLGDAALEKEVLDLFKTHAPLYLARLRAATTVKQWHDAAHTLKGAARGIGAWRVGLCAEEAERLCPGLNAPIESDSTADALNSITAAIDAAIGHIDARGCR